MSAIINLKSKLFIFAIIFTTQIPAQLFARNEGTKSFKDQTGGIEILIPQPWQAIEHSDSDAIQVFLASGRGMFDTGIIYNRILDFKKVYPESDSKHVVAVWTNMMDNNCRSYFSCEVLNTVKSSSGKFQGVKREIRYTPLEGQSSMQAYQLVFYSDNVLIYITMQAPSDEWKEEVTQFDLAVSSLILK